MLYAALTFWLLVIMFTAWGVHHMWSTLVKPRVVNAVLLPGTLIAQLGHILGLLITGNAVQNTSLMSDDDSGAPQTDTPERPRVPIIGPILIGLLPLVACAACLHVAASYWGSAVFVPRTTENAAASATTLLPQALPTSLPAVWDMLRGTLSLSQYTLQSIMNADLTHWPTLLFLYLAICLTVRMAPFEGNRRGTIAAILLAGGVIAILANLLTPVREFLIQSSWPILGFSVGMLVFLLLVSLVVHAIVGLVGILAKSE